MKLGTILAGLCLVVVGESRAATVLGGSLLTVEDAAQIESWLGEGNLTFTNIFSGVPSETFSADFHTAADGQGRTITVYQTMVLGSDDILLIGGYNPLSWDSSEGFHFSMTDEERTAFIFNLTSSTFQGQNLLPNNAGRYQTYNDITFGPTFGGGHDIYMNSFESGYVNANSYGGGITNIIGTNGFSEVVFLGVETYTLGAETPEPASVLMLGLGLLGIGVAKFKKRLPVRS